MTRFYLDKGPARVVFESAEPKHPSKMWVIVESEEPVGLLLSAVAARKIYRVLRTDGFVASNSKDQ